MCTIELYRTFSFSSSFLLLFLKAHWSGNIGLYFSPVLVLYTWTRQITDSYQVASLVGNRIFFFPDTIAAVSATTSHQLSCAFSNRGGTLSLSSRFSYSSFFRMWKKPCSLLKNIFFKLSFSIKTQVSLLIRSSLLHPFHK